MTRAARKIRKWKAWAVIRGGSMCQATCCSSVLSFHGSKDDAENHILDEMNGAKVVRVLITELPAAPRRGAKGAKKGRTA